LVVRGERRSPLTVFRRQPRTGHEPRAANHQL